MAVRKKIPAVKAAPTRAKEIVGTPMTVAEQRAFEALPALEPERPTLSAEERASVAEAVAVTNALVFNALLHRFDPVAYPVNANASAAERELVKELKGLSQTTFSKLMPGIARLNTDAARRKKFLGKLAAVDFHKGDVSRQITRVGGLKRVSLGTMQRVVRPTLPRVVKKSAGTAPHGPVYSEMQLLLRAVHCKVETSGGGSDEMVMGGMLIDPAGTVVPFKGFLLGDFDTGDPVRGYGEHLLARAPLASKVTYPRTFFGIFLLVESDGDDRELAREMTKAAGTIANIVVSAFLTPAAGMAVEAVIGAIGAFFQLFLGDDHFPLWSSRLVQDGPTRFRHHGVTWDGADSPNLRTSNITGHGGAYVVGFKWSMV